MEQSIPEYVKMLFNAAYILAAVAIFAFCFRVSDVNSFKQQVNYQIERKGGLTDEAVMELKNYSNKYYGGSFSVKSDDLNKKVEFGEIVDYEIVGVFEIDMFSKPLKATWEGNAASMTR